MSLVRRALLLRRSGAVVVVLVLTAGLALLTGAPATAQESWPVHRLTPQAPHLPPVPAHQPWSGQVELEVGGLLRTFSVHVPAGLPARAPVVLGLHALYATRESTEATTGLLREAAARRVIVVLPSGVGASWNAGRCCGRAVAARVDDVGFLRRVVAEVDRLHPVDPSRVSAVGYSNGAMMAHRLVCDAPGFLTAAAVVAGADLTGSRCPSAVATPTVVVHGGRDSVVPQAGTPFSAFLGTAVPPQAVTLAALQRRNDAAGVRTLVVRLPTEAHGWPTVRSPSGYDTTRHVLDFVLRSRRPPALRAVRAR